MNDENDKNAWAISWLAEVFGEEGFELLATTFGHSREALRLLKHPRREADLFVVGYLLTDIDGVRFDEALNIFQFDLNKPCLFHVRPPCEDVTGWQSLEVFVLEDEVREALKTLEGLEPSDFA